MLSYWERGKTKQGVTQPDLRRRKYPPLTSETEAELRLAYAGTVREVSSNLQRISNRTGIPKQHLKYEARKRGWRTQQERRPWAPREVAYLLEVVGSLSTHSIARSLRRSVVSVNCRIAKLKLSRRLSAGYNISDLCEAFGLSHTRIENWIARGLLEPQKRGARGEHPRFHEAAVVRFIHEHPREFDLARCDQEWFKDLVFGRWGEYEMAGVRGADANRLDG